ncbi:hypothetical protein NE237_022364 [Protea cynaroides]|uniref:Uncharacterized protein n=1 Tax=Protea cynaroides TaxID=273540 RepID=A0A9Q0HD23_9MAGN|nr:hypothetical protein NE237_022364 [Protea cynaroides]
MMSEVVEDGGKGLQVKWLQLKSAGGSVEVYRQLALMRDGASGWLKVLLWSYVGFSVQSMGIWELMVMVPFPASIYKHRKPTLEAFITIKTSNCMLMELLDLDSLLQNGSDDDDDDLHGMPHCTLDEILSESDSSSSPSSPSSFNSAIFLFNSHSLFNKDGKKRTWLLG